MSDLIVTERGWPGHFIAAQGCLFRRNTLLELGNDRIVVSTVGNYRDHDNTVQEIGWNRHYETMAFRAKWEAPYWEADVTREVSLTTPCGIEGVEQASDGWANDMHEAAVAEIAQLLEEGWIDEIAT